MLKISLSNTLKLLSTVLFSWLLVACASSDRTGPELSQLVVEGASEVSRQSSANGDRLQISYKVSLQYPKKAIDIPQYANLTKSGWRQCLGMSKEWDRIRDTTNNTVVHQSTSHWAKDDQLLTISLRYYSPYDVNSIVDDPAHPVQFVVVLRDRYRSELPHVIERLKIKC